MKKAIIFLSIALMLGCSKDEITANPKPEICDCKKQTWSWQYSNYGTIKDWHWTGVESDYSIDCDDDGLVEDGYTISLNGIVTVVEYRVLCY